VAARLARFRGRGEAPKTQGRRAFAPAEYAGGTVDVGRGILGGSEMPIKMFIDASATSQAGYRLYLFYP